MPLARTLLKTVRTAAVLGTALSGGCTDRDPTAPQPERPHFNFVNGPSSPGPFIVRIPNFGSRVVTQDPNTGLIAIHGTVKNLAECTNASTRVPVDIQIVSTPSEAQAVAFLLTALENSVAIYDQGDLSQLSPFDPVRFCTFINTVAPIYEGVVHYRLHQNGQGSLDFQWEGFLTRLSDGATFHYVERQHFVASGDGTGRWVSEEIRLQPIGSH
jgi:hypothetical protein